MGFMWWQLALTIWSAATPVAAFESGSWRCRTPHRNLAEEMGFMWWQLALTIWSAATPVAAFESGSWRCRTPNRTA
jgi:hypothetical protein